MCECVVLVPFLSMFELKNNKNKQKKGQKLTPEKLEDVKEAHSDSPALASMS